MSTRTPLAPWRVRLHEVIFEAETPAGRAFDVALIAAILLSVAAVLLESVASVRAAYGPELRLIECVLTLLFTLEYLVRLACVERPWRYATSFFGIVDLLAVLPTYVALVAPLYARVGRALIDSIRHDTVVEDPRALEVFAIRPRGIREAIARALAHEDQAFAQTRWSDAVSSGGVGRSWAGTRFGSRIVDARTAHVGVSPRQAFAPIARLGGRTGWYYGDWLWRLRGFLDLLVGGVGVRRGRRDPERLAPGDTVDWWRVEAIEPDRLLRLAAEMRLPGPPGSSSRSPTPPPGPPSPRRRSSTRSAWRGSPTGTRSTRCMGSSSRGCSAASRAPPRAPPGAGHRRRRLVRRGPEAGEGVSDRWATTLAYERRRD